jgi:16S rRNA processing protein RimM
LRAPDRRVLVGVFGAPQGVRGEIRVKSYTDEAKAIGAYGPLTDGHGDGLFVLERLRALKDDMLVVKVKGIETRDAAAGLTGIELFARRDRLPPPKAEEFYYDDLVGLEAVTLAGEALGRVISLSNYGAGDILEIETTDGDVLVLPFTKAVVPRIDLEGGRIVIDPPAEVDP